MVLKIKVSAFQNTPGYGYSLKPPIQVRAHTLGEAMTNGNKGLRGKTECIYF